MKGFTLVELLAVIIVLGIIAAIAYPTTKNIINKNIDKTYQEQINRIEEVSHTWVGTHLDTVGYDKTYYLQFSQLIEDGLLDSSKVLNPKTKKPLTGCIEITWDTSYNQHTVKYIESCPE